MFKLLVLGGIIYMVYRFWDSSVQLPAEKPKEEDFTDYEELD